MKLGSRSRRRRSTSTRPSSGRTLPRWRPPPRVGGDPPSTSTRPGATRRAGGERGDLTRSCCSADAQSISRDRFSTLDSEGRLLPLWIVARSRFFPLSIFFLPCGVPTKGSACRRGYTNTRRRSDLAGGSSLAHIRPRRSMLVWRRCRSLGRAILRRRGFGPGAGLALQPRRRAEPSTRS